MATRHHKDFPLRCQSGRQRRPGPAPQSRLRSTRPSQGGGASPWWLTTRTLTLALLFALSLALPCLAQAADDGFDPAKVQSIGATLTAINTIPATASNGYVGPGLRLAVQSAGETLDVPLGPKWFLDRQPVKLAVGDQITLRGMRPNEKRPLFLVCEIQKEKAVAVYRDREGNLYWKKARAVEGSAKPAPRQKPTN
jgi:hypothetical protein